MINRKELEEMTKTPFQKELDRINQSIKEKGLPNSDWVKKWEERKRKRKEPEQNQRAEMSAEPKTSNQQPQVEKMSEAGKVALKKYLKESDEALREFQQKPEKKPDMSA